MGLVVGLYAENDKQFDGCRVVTMTQGNDTGLIHRVERTGDKGRPTGSDRGWWDG